ncbi:MAG: hypothetical protein MI924_25365 [Chloroflexales bacterium]|nr:hypothetical protein [Chloroflexales bacterium]
MGLSSSIMVDWKKVDVALWSRASQNELLRTAPTYTVTGQLVPPQGEVMRLTLDDELLDELGWDASFARSLDVLERMADDALAEYEAGQTKLLDIDDL